MMPRERKVPARLRDSADFDDIDVEEDPPNSNPESPHKRQRKEFTSSADLVGLSDKHLQAAYGMMPRPNLMPDPVGFHMVEGPTENSVHLQPVYPCGICKREVNDNDDAILCETGCGQWYHRVCTGLSEIAYNLLTAQENAEWVCDNCISTKNIPLVKFRS